MKSFCSSKFNCRGHKCLARFFPFTVSEGKHTLWWSQGTSFQHYKMLVWNSIYKTVADPPPACTPFLLINSVVRFIQFPDCVLWMTHGIKSLTVLVGCVLHSVGPVAFVCDVGVRVGTWWIGDAGIDVAATTLVVSPSVHCEMGGHFPQDACREETNKENQESRISEYQNKTEQDLSLWHWFYQFNYNA